MEIKGTEGLTISQINEEVARGGRFMAFMYCMSFVVVTTKKSSEVRFVKHNERPIKYAWPYLLLTLVLGWWGLPWGPIYTIQIIYQSFTGINLTKEVHDALKYNDAIANATPINYNVDSASEYGINQQK